MKRSCILFLSIMLGHALLVSESQYNYRTGNLCLTSVPKAGTHLLVACVHLLTERNPINLMGDPINSGDPLPPTPNNEFIFQHIKYTQEAENFFRDNNYRGIMIYRDPRDQVVSLAFFLHKHLEFREYPSQLFDDGQFSALLQYLIKNVTYKHYDWFIPWINNTEFCAVRFENLVGPHGGGTYELQITEIQKITDHLNIPLTQELLDNCTKNMFGNTATFREGKIGSWQKYFTQEDKEVFKKSPLGKTLVYLKYEIDDNW